MASNELTIPTGDQKVVLPDYLQQAYGEAASNIITSDRANTLTIRGKVFTITSDGEETALMKRDEETGDEQPLQSLPVVILDYAVRQGRSFYEGNFDPSETKEPLCWSKDGVTPDETVPEKQAERCALCRNAVKGSKVTDNGKAVVACAPHRILVVVPIKRLETAPLRLRIAQTSEYDGRSPEMKAKGFFAFRNYLESLKGRGLNDTKTLVTSLSFDPMAAFPKLFFRALRYVKPEEHAKIREIMASGQVEEILGDTGTSVAGTKPALAPRAGSQAATPALPAPKPAAAAPAAQAAAKPAAAAPGPAGEFSFRAMEPGEDEDDYTIAKATARKEWTKAQASRLATPQPVPFRAMEPGEDEDDYALAKAAHNKAEKARIAAAGGAAPAAARAPFPAFEQVEGEDEDDQTIRRATWSKAKKAYEAGGPLPAEFGGKAAAAPAAKPAAAPVATQAKGPSNPQRERGKPSPGRQRRTKEEMAEDNALDAAEGKAPAVAEEVPAAETKPAEKFLPNAIDGNDMGDDEDDGELAVTSAAKPTAQAKPNGSAASPRRIVAEPLPAGTPADVGSILDEWGDE